MAPPEFNPLNSYASFTFNWKIENFTMGMLIRKHWLCSPIITLPVTAVSWKILLHPNLNFSKYIAVYVQQIEEYEHGTEMELFATLSISDTSNSESYKVSFSSRNDCKKFHYWGSKKFISWNSLLTRKDSLLPGDNLHIRCELNMRFDIVKPGLINLLKDVTDLCYTEVAQDLAYSFMKVSCDNDINNVLDSDTDDECHCDEIDKDADDECHCDDIDKDADDECRDKIDKERGLLRRWFSSSLYSDELLKTIFASRVKIDSSILKDMGRWPNGVPVNWEFRSFFKTECSSFTWFIKEFNDLLPNIKLYSPVFCCGSSKWKLMFYVDGDIAERGVVQIFICPVSVDISSKKVIKCRISVVNIYGRLPVSEETLFVFDNDGEWKFPTFMRIEALRKNKDLYLANNILCLYCTFSITDEKYSYDDTFSWTETEFKNSYIELCGLWHLSQNMLGLFKSGFGSDIELKVGKQKIPAHKSVLIKRSKEFRLIFSAENAEKKSVIELNNVDENTFKKLLEYLYSGILESESVNDFKTNILPTALSYRINDEVVEKLRQFYRSW